MNIRGKGAAAKHRYDTNSTHIHLPPSLSTFNPYDKRRATVFIVLLCDQSCQPGIHLSISFTRRLALSVHSMNTSVHPVGRQEQQRTPTAPICISCPQDLIGHITC